MRFVSQYISLWVVDDLGDTPLYTCARLRATYSANVLLKLNPPVLVRINLGLTPKDLEQSFGELTDKKCLILLFAPQLWFLAKVCMLCSS